jgi:hypothetical protein
MMVLKKVQDVYSSATFIHGLFMQAIEKLNSPDYTGLNTPPQHLSPPYHSAADGTNQAALQGRIDLIPMDNFWQIDDLMLDFWEPVPTFSGPKTVEEGSVSQ